MTCFLARDLHVWVRVVVLQVKAKAFDTVEEEIGIYSILWMESWCYNFRRIESPNTNRGQDDWISVPLDLENIRVLMKFMLEDYLKSNQTRSKILAGVQAMC